MKPSSSVIVIGLVCSSLSGLAHAYTFDASMLDTVDKNVDISLLNQGGQLPGVYPVEVLLNGERVDSREIDFHLEKNAKGEPFLQPCLSVALLSRYGVKVEDYPALAENEGTSAAGSCARLSAIPKVTAVFHFNNQQLLLGIPQVSLRPKLQGIAPETLWDDGINAFVMNYRANVNRTEARGNTARQTDSQFAVLEPGANLGAWRIRNSTTWQKQGERPGEWQSAYTYAARGLNRLKSRLTIGERFTPPDIFDSVPFRGVMLGSDDEMVPYNQRAYAPVVRGIARTQARVEVKQNGFTVANEVVAPGAFALTDLSLSSFSGDLQVTVWETDGAIQVFTVPYSTPAIALREGYLKYNLMAGQYRAADSSIDRATIGQASLMYGLPWDLTAYGGAQMAENYQAMSLGVGVGLGYWGSVSLDATGARGQRKGHDTEQGATWRMRYSKVLEATNTSLGLASYQYASAGYNTLFNVLDSYREQDGHGSRWDDGRGRRKSRTTLSLGQPLAGWGSLSLNGSRETYRDRTGHDDSFGASYAIGLRYASLSVSWAQHKQIDLAGGQKTDRIASLQVNVPLDRWLGGATNASYQMISPAQGATLQEVGLNGNTFDRQLSWNVRQQYRPDPENGDRNSSALQLTWFDTYGQFGGNYSYSPNMRQMGANMAGGMVIHRNGITVGQPMGNTVALVEAPGISGVPVNGGPGVKTDFRGYAMQAYLSPYQENTVGLNSAFLPPDTEVTQTTAKVVPTAGAVIPAAFATRIGGRALLTLARPGGETVPFGAAVNVSGQQGGVGIVNEEGQVYLTGLPEQGELLVKWGQQQCRVNYQLPKEKGAGGLYMMNSVCH